VPNSTRATTAGSNAATSTLARSLALGGRESIRGSVPPDGGREHRGEDPESGRRWDRTLGRGWRLPAAQHHSNLGADRIVDQGLDTAATFFGDLLERGGHAYASVRGNICNHATTAGNGCGVAAQLQTKRRQRPHSRGFANQRRQAGRFSLSDRVRMSGSSIGVFRLRSGIVPSPGQEP